MRVVVVYRSESEYGTIVDTFLRDFSRQTGHNLEVLSPDSPAGDAFCRDYDVVEYPSIIALGPDGQLENFWRGLPLPTISEVSYYV